jgi:hypothetical protein
MKANERRAGSAAKPAPNFGRRPFPAAPVERPLSIPEQKARARWQRPVPAVIAGALAVNRGLLERLRAGMYAPDREHDEEYQVIFNGLLTTTREQVAALELFGRVDWE